MKSEAMAKLSKEKKRSLISITLWIIISILQFAVCIHLREGALGALLFAISFSQMIFLLRTSRSSVIQDRERPLKVKDPNNFIRSSYIKAFAYLFISALFEAFLVGKMHTSTSYISGFFIELWFGHVVLVGSLIVRFWGLSLGHAEHLVVKNE